MTAALALDLAWKSAVLAALVLAAAALLRSRPAAERVAFLRLGMVAVLALPLLTVLVPALRVEVPALAMMEPPPVAGPLPDRAPIPGPVPNVAPVPGPLADALPVQTAAPAPAPRLPHVSLVALLAAVWLVGVAALLARLLGGVATLALWTRRARPVTDPLWRAALDRAAVGARRPKLKVSTRIASPLSWGWPRGIILIDETTLSRPDRADAVLTHEMGHVRHHDWLFLMLSHALVAVLWFNPFVWRLRMELARQSEQAADAWAVRRISRTDYAGALVAMARSARPHAALGMAGPTPSDLARRVAAVLDASRGKGRPWATGVAAVACLGMAGPLAALEWSPSATAAALHPAAPAPRAVPTTAAAVVALLPAALADPVAAPPAKDLKPDALAALIRQRDRGLEMFEAGAQAMEAGVANMRRQATLIPDQAQRDELLRQAVELQGQAEALRAQARDFAARDPATLTPMTEEEDRQMTIELANLRAVPLQMNLEMSRSMDMNVQADVQVDFPMPIPLPAPVSPPEPPREQIAAGLREGARQMRADAAKADADALRIEQDPSLPEDMADHAADLRGQADDLRGQADDLEREADDVMSD